MKNEIMKIQGGSLIKKPPAHTLYRQNVQGWAGGFCRDWSVFLLVHRRYSVTFTYSSGESSDTAPILKYCMYALSSRSLSIT